MKSMLVSSANKTGIAFLFMTAGKSFMYKRNSLGPSIDPCGKNVKQSRYRPGVAQRVPGS